MDWSAPINPLTLIFTVMTLAVSVVMGILNWRRAGSAIGESVASPQRTRQFERLDELAQAAENLHPILSDKINLDVQQSFDGNVIRADASELEAHTKILTTEPTIDRELQRLLSRLHNLVFVSPEGPGDSWVSRLRGFAYSLDEVSRRIDVALNSPLTDESARSLVQAGGERDRFVESLRAQNHEMIQIVNDIKDRIKILKVEGFGRIGGRRAEFN